MMEPASCATGVGASTAELKETLALELGGELHDLKVKWEDWGDKSVHKTCDVLFLP